MPKNQVWPTIYPYQGRKGHWHEMKRKHPRPRFELELPVPFPTTIMLWAPSGKSWFNYSSLKKSKSPSDMIVRKVRLAYNYIRFSLGAPYFWFFLPNSHGITV